MIRWIVSLLLLAPLLHAQQGSIKAQFAGSNMVVTKESATLQVIIENAEIYGWPDTPRAAPLTIKQARHQYTIINGRKSLTFNYSVSSYRAGIFEIPPFKIKTSQGVIQSEPLTFRVFDNKILTEGLAEAGGNQFPYFTGLFLSKDKPYVSEEQAVILKLFIPNDIRIAHSPLAEVETKNLAAWRFEYQNEGGLYQHNGKTYRTFTYSSSISPLKDGTAVLGPGKITSEVTKTISRLGFTRWRKFKASFNVPKLEIQARPLPTPAPEGFEGAVGNFKITSLPTAQTLKLGESLTVDLAVTGSGNLDQLRPPRLTTSKKDWKLFDAIRVTQGTERRKAGGTASFNQVLRPLKVVDELPPYRLVFFDPLIEEYRTALSAPYPLVITGATATENAEASPLIALIPGTMKSLEKSRPWLWQLAPASLALVTFFIWLSRLFKGKKMSSLPAQEFENELAELKTVASKNRPEFYRAIGHFLERWPHEDIDKEAQELVQTRDDICFSPDENDEAVLPKEREKILTILKRCAPLLIAGFLFAPSPAEASFEKHWQAGEFAQGAEILRKQITDHPSPSAYYNLGCFEDKLEHDGTAALCLYRALASDPTLDRAPLEKFTSRTGALTQRQQADDDWLSILSRTSYREIFLLGIWLLILALTAKVLLNSPNIRKRLITLFLILSPLALLAGGLGWWYYPTEITYRPLLEASVVMSKQTLRQSPHAEGESFRDIPAGSLGYVTAERGTWSFVEFTGGLNGWLPKDTLNPVAGSKL